MRAVICIVVLLLSVGEAFAQTEEDYRSLRTARGRQVAVIDADSREWQGLLLDIANDAVTVEIESQAHRFELMALKRVDARGDRVWDGAARGAVFGVLIGALALGDLRFAAQGALTWGLIGAGLDALHSCTHTVYRAPATPVAIKVSW